MINNWTGEPAGNPFLLPLAPKNAVLTKTFQAVHLHLPNCPRPPADLQHPKKSTKSSKFKLVWCVSSRGDTFLWVTAVNKWLKVGGGKRKPTRRDGRRREASSETVAPQSEDGAAHLCFVPPGSPFLLTRENQSSCTGAKERRRRKGAQPSRDTG